ncbi:GNAT family N-acetyltransferase [Wenjunlia tyrosinilytica]|jgi:CelD/BcsL family acetyltransferase involved in cellulose biosynthesis|uniref:Glycosyl transferase n=1 Tax=Wenjunlia tyrosinilytica TaxID=1544741 RepID=A0A917ZWS1_9ACTN|nr:GNAT family N-acetyltransferase [Wenjunlia tyrosinilytica]GGO96144.1 glycosyl transferase [Wenjunlia tyrosinilytica]
MAAPEPEIHRDPGTLAAHEDGWRQLAVGGSYFTTPDWMLAWWRSYPDAGRGEVAVWRGPDGRVEAVAPLMRTRHRLRPNLPLSVPCLTLLGSGTGAADHLGFPALRHRRDDVRRWLARRAGGISLWLPSVDESAAPMLPPGLRPLARTAAPRLDLTADPARLGSADHRQNLRRYGRKLDRAGVSFRWVAPKEMTPGVLDDVLRLHRLRADSIGRATTFTTERRAFHLRLIEAASRGAGAGERGPCALLAEHDGAAVGAVYGFWWGACFAYYQTGWEPRLAPLRLGLQLVARCVGEAREHGAAVFDFLRGGEPYKYRFGAVDRYDTDSLLPHGPAGALLRAKFHAKQRTALPDGQHMGGRGV